MAYIDNDYRRRQAITNVKTYFQIYELVGRKTYKKFGEDSWQFLDTEALECLYIIRHGIGKPCIINDWFWGGKSQQRGFRTNIQQIFRRYFTRNKLYLSGHVLGKAFDLIFDGISAPEVREWIINNQDLFPCKLRLECLKNGKEITWVHFDTKHLERNPKVYTFNV